MLENSSLSFHYSFFKTDRQARMSASFLLVFAELNVDNMVQAVLKVPTMKTRKTFVSEDSYKKRPILFG